VAVFVWSRYGAMERWSNGAMERWSRPSPCKEQMPSEGACACVDVSVQIYSNLELAVADDIDKRAPR